MKAMVLGVVAMLAGCAAKEPCAPRVGTYEVTISYLDGDCMKGTKKFDIELPGSQDPMCTSTVTETEDKCDITTSLTCSNGFTSSRASSTVTWSEDGLSGKGVIRIEDGEHRCKGNYAVSYSKKR